VIEVLKSRGFTGSFCWLGFVASFVYLDGVFNSWCRALKLDVGVDPFVLSLQSSEDYRYQRLFFRLAKHVRSVD
jgi:hypothetical protein